MTWVMTFDTTYFYCQLFVQINSQCETDFISLIDYEK